MESAPAPEVWGRRRWVPEGLRTCCCSPPDPKLHYLSFVPVIDGDFIPDDPVNLYANAADIDYIAGTNDMDGHLFVGLDVPAINSNKRDVTE